MPFIDKLIEAGITAFKIEGRARSPEYVKTVTECYRTAIDAHKEGKFTKELSEKLVEKLKTVYNRGFSTGFYLGLPTGEDFTDTHGTKATQVKQYIGYVIDFYKKQGVAAVKLEAGGLKVGDRIMIQGQKTGVQEQKVESMEISNKPVKEAGKGLVGIKLNFEARENDQVFLIVDNKE